MDYPDYLLPKQNYRHIGNVQSVIDRSIARFYLGSKEAFLDPITKLPQEKCVAERSSRLMDLSTSLVGNFHPDDNKYVIIGPRKIYFANEVWPEGELVAPPPSREEFQIQDTVFNYFFLVSEVHNYSVKFSIPEEGEFNATLKVKHTPRRSNFWHFSIRVLDQNNEDIGDRNHGRRKPFSKDSRILKAAQKALCSLVKYEVLNFENLPLAIYCYD